MKLAQRIAWLVVAALLSTPVYAQKLYRCGSAYQDQPCAGGQAGTVVGSTHSSVAAESGSAAAARGSAADEECTQRAKDSLKISWRREAGATAERQLAAAGGSSERELIESVYRKRGTAREVSVVIEAQCMEQKEKLRQAALLQQAANRLAGQAAANPGAAYGGQKLAKEPDLRARAETTRQAPGADEDHKSQCARWSAQLNKVRAQQRRGGDAQSMEALRERYSEIQKSATEKGC